MFQNVLKRSAHFICDEKAEIFYLTLAILLQETENEGNRNTSRQDASDDTILVPNQTMNYNPSDGSNITKQTLKYSTMAPNRSKPIRESFI